MKRDLASMLHEIYLEIEEEAIGFQRKQLIKLALTRLKEENNCEDCNQFFPSVCMEFDHLANKEFAIGNGNGKELGSILDELSKCKLVCSNCHRIRTHKMGRSHSRTKYTKRGSSSKLS